LGISCDPLGALLIVGERGVEEVYVGVNRLLGERLPGLPLSPRLVSQLLGGGAPAPGLLSEVVQHPLGEVLGEAPPARLSFGEEVFSEIGLTPAQHS
jgi:hypothetical protein